MSRVHRLPAALAALALCAALASPAAAQTTASASIQAIAFVQGVAPITATGVNDLNFGTVFAGATTGLTNLASQAGRFDIAGEPAASVSVSFTLPVTLAGPGGSIPISFGIADGLEWNPFPGSSTTFNPNVPYLTALSGAGVLTIGIAGSVAPPAGTTTGNYTGTITLTVSYL